MQVLKPSKECSSRFIGYACGRLTDEEENETVDDRRCNCSVKRKEWTSFDKIDN